ncbi:MAG: ABC transporter permease [Firmicutes bacterium]|uniref:ABC transporter permease n=1 Tax=Candidatus Scybalomonas excrementavium TaxID=2840943 RepID=A0A9D9N742_9FIRM|nr:ABC transporter permease [Candidatus Scybalomonas excrementavium]
MQMNPILRNELKLHARTVRLPIILVIYNLVLSCVAVLFMASIQNQYQSGYPIQYDELMEIFTILGWIQCVLVCFMVPILTASAIAGEREKQTLDIMLTTSISPFSIILGKLVAAMCTVCILVLSSVPILSISFLFGGMSWKDMIAFLFVVIAIGVFVGSIGLFFSSLVKKTPVAIVLTFLVLGIVIIGTVAFFPIANAIYETITYDRIEGTMKSLEFGWASLLMIVNPVVLFLDFMEKSSGRIGVANYFNSWFGVASSSDIYTFAEHWWIVVSLLIQIGLALLFLMGAAFFINPLKGKKRKK